MAETEYSDVRVEESLRVKIGEIKNLPASSFSGSGRSTCCAIKIDSEEIFRTSTVEKSLDPFFGAEFQGEIPKKFRYLSVYAYEVGNKNKVLGKVSLKKEELYKYYQKDHWFPLTYQDGDTEVQGKVQLEVKLEEYLTPSSDTSQRIAVRVLECSDLTVINGSCNPYAVVTLSYGKSKTKEVKRTTVKKKTICPQFDETFFFHLEGKGQNQERSMYVFEDFMAGEVSVSLFHDDSKVSREVLGNIFKGSFLGEVKIPTRDIVSRPHKAWYCLQAKEQNRTSDISLGSIRLRISYTADYVFPSKYYDGLRNLILISAESKPFTSSATFILGEIVNNRESAAQPLVKLFLHHGKLVPLIHALADWEMSNTVDPNTVFRGNSLLTKMVDELMKLTGMPYLQDTLKSFIDQVVSEAKPCEIDPSRMKEGEDIATNLTNLHGYVSEALNTIVNSGLVCPAIMRDVFSTLKSQAIQNYPENVAVRYHAVTSFIFLRFFTAAIMGPNLFDLYSDILDPLVQRTFTLISKGISGLVNLVSSKSNNITTKEEYMTPLYEMFPKSTQSDIKMFLDIISSRSRAHFKGIEAPIVLKEGFLIKRAQGRKKFGLKNFKKRFFRLTNQSLSYSKSKGDRHLLFDMPITDILAVERLEEETFKMKYMFQVVHKQRALYIQARNCVEEKEWLDILTKICKSNRNRLKVYHPGAFINNHWLCCKATDQDFSGCKPVTGGLPLADIQGDIDSDREVEKIHSLFLAGIDQLDALQGYVDDEDDITYDESCGKQAVYSGDLDVRTQGLGANIEDPPSCFITIAEIQRCVITLEQEHIQYMRSVHRRTVIGSIDTPIGDESNADLVRNLHRSSERLSRHGSRSSNASNVSRRSARDCRSRGGSFRERERGKLDGERVRKSLSGDVLASVQNLGVDFKSEVKKAVSYDVMTVEVGDTSCGGRKRTVSGGSRKDSLDTCSHGSHYLDSPKRLTANGGLHPMNICDLLPSYEMVARKSTGFVPVQVSSDSNELLSTSRDMNFSAVDSSFSTSGHATIDSDLTSNSFSSQNVGMLEKNDETFTTANIGDTKEDSLQTPLSTTTALHVEADSHSHQSSDTHVGQTVPELVEYDCLKTSVQQQVHPSDIVHFTSDRNTSDPHACPELCVPHFVFTSLLDEKDIHTEAPILVSDNSLAHLSTHQNGDVLNLQSAADISLATDLQGSWHIQGPYWIGHEHLEHLETCSMRSSDLAVQRSFSEPCHNASVSESRTTRQLSLEMDSKHERTSQSQWSTDPDLHSVSNCGSLQEACTSSSALKVSSVAFRGELSPPSKDRPLENKQDLVKYTLPELTSSCHQDCAINLEPSVATWTSRTESSNSTPALSPIDISAVEILLLSNGSDSSQDKC